MTKFDIFCMWENFKQRFCIVIFKKYKFVCKINNFKLKIRFFIKMEEDHVFSNFRALWNMPDTHFRHLCYT